MLPRLMQSFKEFRRLWPGLSRMGRRFLLLLRQPDAVNLHGVDLELGAWATPGIRQLVYHGWYEENERAVIAETLRPDDVVLELGCGAGYITTVAAGIACEVRGFEANPEMVQVARETLRRNGTTAIVENAVVERVPTEATIVFYVEPEFIASSLKPSATATSRVDVPTRELANVVDGCTYLVADIEGAEVDLLRGDLRGIRAICVETHPSTTGLRAISELLASLFEQGFALDVERTRRQVLYLQRDTVPVASTVLSEP